MPTYVGNYEFNPSVKSYMNCDFLPNYEFYGILIECFSISFLKIKLQFEIGFTKLQKHIR